MNYLEIRNNEEVKKLHLSEIHTLIIENTGVSLTCALLAELIHRKIKVIFCDEKRNPLSELIPYYGSHDSSACVRQQIQWEENQKGLVWAEVVAEKIRKQQELLLEAGAVDRAVMLGRYVNDVQEADASNREGHAAKVYFGGLFGANFTRSSDCPINAALNYGYSILLSSFNREIAAKGYLTQIGIFHDNMFNPYNLASDMMEPFRPLVDRIVYQLQPEEMTKEVKYALVDLLNEQVMIDGNKQYVSAAIRIYCASVIEAMNQKDTGEIKFYSLITTDRKAKKVKKKTADEPKENEKEKYEAPEVSVLQRKVDQILNLNKEGT